MKFRYWCCSLTQKREQREIVLNSNVIHHLNLDELKEREVLVRLELKKIIIEDTKTAQEFKKELSLKMRRAIAKRTLLYEKRLASIRLCITTLQK